MEIKILEITTEKSGKQKNKNVICLLGEEFSKLTEVARFISENCIDDWNGGKIKPSSTKETITQSQWEKLEKLVKELAEDSVESIYDDYNAYA